MYIVSVYVTLKLIFQQQHFETLLAVSSYKESCNNKPMYGYMQERLKRVTRSYLIYALLLYMYVNPICALALTYTKYNVFTITM